MSESEKTIQEECYGTCWGAQQRIDELTQQLNLANERIKRLEEAGQELLYDNDDMANIYRWHKAKEIKP
jgi:hypothetical protein